MPHFHVAILLIIRLLNSWFLLSSLAFFNFHFQDFCSVSFPFSPCSSFCMGWDDPAGNEGGRWLEKMCVKIVKQWRSISVPNCARYLAVFPPAQKLRILFCATPGAIHGKLIPCSLSFSGYNHCELDTSLMSAFECLLTDVLSKFNRKDGP